MSKEYRVTREQMVEYRALLMIKLKRHISWVEFADLIGIHRMTCYHVRSGRRRAGIRTINKIVRLMREHGIIIHLSDFEA